jgi:hypothetical protein
MISIRVTYSLCEKYQGSVINDLCLGDLSVVRDQVTCPLCEKYLGSFMNGLYLSNLYVVRDRVT